jgi:two-component system chemotaxis response regulator CheB
MLSALDSPRGGDLTIRALELGAVDFVRKPIAADALDPHALRDRLLIALRAASAVNLGASAMLARPRFPRKAAHDSVLPAAHVVAIAASTGGPRALAEIIPALPADLRAAILIVQHMPAGFTESLARRLDRLSPLPVREGRHDDVILEGHVYIAPGGRHMTVEPHASGAGLRIVVFDGPPILGVRPSADTLFLSVARYVGPRAVGVVLTGMGRDGSDGLRGMRAAGAYSLVQDRQSSTVFGMPLMALEMAGADRVAPLAEVASAIRDGLAARGVHAGLGSGAM